MKPHLKSICTIFPSPYLSGNTVLFRKVFILRDTKFFRYFLALSCFCFFLILQDPVHLLQASYLLYNIFWNAHCKPLWSPLQE